MDSRFWSPWFGFHVTLNKLLNLHVHDLIFKVQVKIVLTHRLVRVKGGNRFKTLPSPDSVQFLCSSFTLFLSRFS